MGRGLLVGGIGLGALALLWGFVLLQFHVVLAARGGVTSFLPLSMVAFAAGATSIAAGVVGQWNLALGSFLVLFAGAAGLITPALTLLLNSAAGTGLTQVIVAFMAVAWWAVLMVVLGGGTLLSRARRAELNDAAAGP